MADGKARKGEDEGTRWPEGELRRRRREVIARLSLIKRPFTPDEARELHEAYDELLAAHHEVVWNYLSRRGRNKEDAEDAHVETFATAYHEIVATGFPDSPKDFLLGIAKNKLWNIIRTRKRSRLSLGLPSSRSEPPKTPLDVARLMDLDGLAVRLQDALSDDEWDVFDLVLLSGLRCTEAAELLGIPVGTAYTRHKTVKEAIAKLTKGWEQ